MILGCWDELEESLNENSLNVEPQQTPVSLIQIAFSLHPKITIDDLLNKQGKPM